MKQPKYRFYLSINSGDFIEIHPHYTGLNKKYTKENGQEFFRVSLEGKLGLIGTDFELIASQGIDSEFCLMVDMIYQGVYYKGKFSKTDCTLDFSKKRCELKTLVLDEYTEIMNKYDTTYDLIKLAPALTSVSLHKRSLMQIYVKGANTISNFFGGTYWESEVNEVIDDDNALKNTYYFANIANANEFYVEGSGNALIDGIYAGVDGKWNNNKGYEAAWEFTQLDGTSYYGYWLVIRKIGTTEVLFRSKEVLFDSPNADLPPSSVVGSQFIPSGSRFDMLDSAGAKAFSITTVFAYQIYRRLLCDVDSIGNGTATYDLPLNDFVSDNRNFKKCIGLLDGLVFCTSYTKSTPTRFGVNDYGEYFTDDFIPLSAGLGRALPICRSIWVNASLWYVYDFAYEVWEPQLRKKYTVEDAYSIADVIKVLLNQIDPTITHEATAEYSRFLYDADVPPIGMARFYVYITQKTNILKGDYDQAAQKAEISLKELMEMLRDCFRCYWFIENGKFKIEHVWYFMNGGSYDIQSNYQLDATSLVDQFNHRPNSYFQSQIEYDKSSLPAKYKFSWMDEASEPFTGPEVNVLSKYVQQDSTEEINLSKFSSDVDFMLFNPSAFSNDGFALLLPELVDEELILPIRTVSNIAGADYRAYSITAQNSHATWLSLVNFYTRDISGPDFRVNGERRAVYGVKKCMKHSIQLPLETDLDILGLIKTEFGDGKIEEMSIDLDTRQAKIKLAYTPT